MCATLRPKYHIPDVHGLGFGLAVTYESACSSDVRVSVQQYAPSGSSTSQYVARLGTAGTGGVRGGGGAELSPTTCS